MSTPGDQKKGVRSGVIDDIENALTAGYGKKEDLRALDKAIRDRYYSELMTLRHRWEKVYLAILESGQSAIGRECKSIIQIIDRLAERVHRADYGYAPLFDRVKKVQEQSLQSVLEFDRGLAKNLTDLSQTMVNAEEALKTSSWPSFNVVIQILNENLKTFEENWDKRKQAMNS